MREGNRGDMGGSESSRHPHPSDPTSLHTPHPERGETQYYKPLNPNNPRKPTGQRS